MVKKLLLMLLLAVTLQAAAQSNGTWILHPTFVGSSIQNIYDTGDAVYYLVSNNLFRFDKSTEENESISKENSLSDVVVDGIYYNYDKKYLAVAYRNSNIDFLLDDGRVVNMPDIKDAVLTTSKTINDITFAGDLVYVATNFGYVVINDARWEVKESHIFNTALTCVAQVGETLLLHTGSTTYVGTAGEYKSTLASYKKATSMGASAHFLAIDDSHFFVRNNSAFSKATITGSGAAATLAATQVVAAKAENVQPTKTGFIANFKASSYYYTFDAAGDNATKVSGGAEMYSCSPAGDGTLWVVGANGLHTAGSTSYYKPNSLSMADPYYVLYNAGLNKIYINNVGPYPQSETWNKGTNYVNTYDGNTWTDASVAGTTGSGPGWINFIPGEPNSYVQGVVFQGIFKVTDGVKVLQYNGNNSPINTTHAVARFDRHGNLMVTSSFNNSANQVWILPADKVKASSVSKSDWITQSTPGVNLGTFRYDQLVCPPTNDMMVYIPGAFGYPIFFIDESNINNTSPRLISFTSVNDQDGNGLDWTWMYDAQPDLDGNVWVCHAGGIFYANPTEAFDSNFHVTRPKIARNDGTNLADYLLDGMQVNCITVDANNHKWIGTQYSGIFEVSADNTQILNTFNTSNSDLPSNTVYHLAYNTQENSLFAVTNNGVAEYRVAATSGAAADLSDVYAYPNPVRPDFTGLVTIAGLMENTLVKIADSSGNVVKQLKSSGGKVTWDACDNDGERMPTGVYFVLASDANNNGSEKVVTKLMIIK